MYNLMIKNRIAVNFFHKIKFMHDPSSPFCFQYWLSWLIVQLGMMNHSEHSHCKIVWSNLVEIIAISDKTKLLSKYSNTISNTIEAVMFFYLKFSVCWPPLMFQLVRKWLAGFANRTDNMALDDAVAMVYIVLGDALLYCGTLIVLLLILVLSNKCGVIRLLPCKGILNTTFIKYRITFVQGQQKPLNVFFHSETVEK